MSKMKTKAKAKKVVKLDKWNDRVKKLSDTLGGAETVASRLGVSFYTVIRWIGGSHQPSMIAQRLIVNLEKELKG